MAIATVITTINGQEYNLTYNSGADKWEATLTAPSLSSFNQSGGYYDVTVKATDTASNETTVDSTHSTLGSTLRLVVKEKVKPTITITSPGAGGYIINNKPTITFQLRDNDSGIKISTLALKIDSGTTIGNGDTGMTTTPVSGGYDCTYTPATALTDGGHTVTINISDNDDNAATAASRTFTIDTVPPVLNVTSPVDGLETNQSVLTVVGITNDATSSPVEVVIKLNTVSQGAITVDSSGNFSKQIQLIEGENTIEITATDSAGKSSTVTRTVMLQTTAPVITAVEIVPNPADAGQTYVIKVTVQ